MSRDPKLGRRARREARLQRMNQQNAMLLRWFGRLLVIRWWGRIFALMATVSGLAVSVALYATHGGPWGLPDMPQPITDALADVLESKHSLTLLWWGYTLPALFGVCSYLCGLFSQEPERL